jgi:hypothetical protein
MVERGGGVDGGDGLSLAGAGLRQAGGKTEDEDKQGCCSQRYTPLPLIVLHCEPMMPRSIGRHNRLRSSEVKFGTRH